MLTIRRARRSLAIAAALLLAGCAGSEPSDGPVLPPGPATFELVSGGDQSAMVGEALAEPIIARVRVADGRPVVGLAVHFRVAGGGGTVVPEDALTDADGHASARWRLGTSAGVHRLEITTVDPTSLSALGPIAVPATAVPGPPAQVGLSIGDYTGTTRLSGATIKAALRDAWGNGIAGGRLDLSASGGGSVTPSSGVTNGVGQLDASWTFGFSPGLETIRAEYAGLPPAELTHEVTLAEALAGVYTGTATGTSASCVRDPLVLNVHPLGQIFEFCSGYHGCTRQTLDAAGCARGWPIWISPLYAVAVIEGCFTYDGQGGAAGAGTISVTSSTTGSITPCSGTWATTRQ